MLHCRAFALKVKLGLHKHSAKNYPNDKLPMKFKLISIFFLNAIILTGVRAEDPANIIRTVEKADIEKISDFLLFSSSKKFPTRVPQRISASDSFSIQYSAGGKLVQEHFTVMDISIRGDLCWLHSKRRTKYDTSPSDTIYVQPCARLQ